MHSTEAIPKARQQIAVSVSEGAVARWQEFAYTQGVSLTALVEALGPFFNYADRTVVSAIVQDAKTIDATRRRELRQSGMPE